MKREKSEVLETLKAENYDVGADLGQYELMKIKDINTKFGEKTVAVVQDNESNKFDVFLNTHSTNALIEGIGDDDDLWKGKLVTIKCENDTVFNNKMLVVTPIK